MKPAEWTEEQDNIYQTLLHYGRFSRCPECGGPLSWYVRWVQIVDPEPVWCAHVAVKCETCAKEWKFDNLDIPEELLGSAGKEELENAREISE